MLKPDDFKRSIQAIDALGATPSVLVKVTELVQDPNMDIATICAAIRNDGPLVADLIRLANSPYYAPATFHSHLTSAMSFIGLREVLRVVNLSLARQLFARNLSSYGITAKDYWSASVAAALVMESLAKPAGLHPENAYTLGILHAIGRVLINRIIEEKGFAIFWDGHQPIEEWERSALGFDYAEAGAVLLEHWRFPAATYDVIRRQLQPGPVPETVSLLSALQFTRRLLALTGLDFEKQNWQLPEADPFLQASGLDAAFVSELVADCRESFQRILQSVDVTA